MRYKIISLSLSVSLIGCAATPQYQWAKEGASSHERETALSECEYQIKLNKTPPQEQRELRGLCMKGKGWRVKQV
jgi:hypothetical protein